MSEVAEAEFSAALSALQEFNQREADTLDALKEERRAVNDRYKAAEKALEDARKEAADAAADETVEA